MKDVIYDEFQNKVDDVLIRHANFLDILSKVDEASSKTNRAAVKTITQCGCVHLNTDVKNDDPDSLERNHLTGDICPVCREKLEEELGKLQFYINALCNALDLNMYDILLKEYNKINTLGRFSLY